MAKELQQLAPLPPELEPELELDEQNSPRGLLDREKEESNDLVAARAYLAERGLINARFSPLEAAARVSAVGSTVLGTGVFVAGVMGMCLGIESAIGGVPLGVAFIFAPLMIDRPQAPKIVRKLAAQITQSRREKLRSWAVTHYGVKFDDSLLSELQSELAALEQSSIIQLQRQLALTPPRAMKLEELTT